MSVTSDSNDGAIAVVSLIDEGLGGLEHHMLNLVRELIAAGRAAILVVPESSQLQRCARERDLPCHALSWVRWVRGQTLRDQLLYRSLLRLGRQQRLAAIHCNNRFEAGGVRRAAARLRCTSVMSHHVPSQFDAAGLSGFDAIAAPNPEIVAFLKHENTQRRLGIRTIEHIPPVLDAARWLGFRDERSPQQWALDTLGIRLREGPLLCMIGNMVPDLEHKNYPLLFRALHQLKNTGGARLQALLVGDGPARGYLEGLSRELGLIEDVHFLGYLTNEVSGVIAMSDFCVLASSREAFGMVLVEAALMGKAAVAARGTGAEQIVMHGQTGLLFENGDASSLAQAIASLISQPELALRLGRSAQIRAQPRFSPKLVVSRYLALYESRRTASVEHGALH